ncbi:hypothetical protein GCM10028807_60270 [Spirosoma daeguense]
MTTLQTYMPHGGYATSYTQKAHISSLNVPERDNRSPRVSAELKGLDLDNLERIIDERVKTNPIILDSPLDGLAILRDLSQHPDEENFDCHYAIFLRDQQVVGITCLNREGETDSIFEGEYLPPKLLNTRYLMTLAAECRATSVLLASSRHFTANNVFDSAELDYIATIENALSIFSIKLLDWLIIIPSENNSWRWQLEEGESLYRVNQWLFTDFGVRYAEIALA